VRPELRAFAETPDRYTALSDDVRRVDDGRACILYGPTFAAVSGLDVDAAELRSLLDDARRLVRPPAPTIWLLGPSTRPVDAGERLRALGLRPPPVPRLHGLVLTAPPPAVPGVEVRAAETFEDYAAAVDVQWEVFETPLARRATREHVRASFRAQQASGNLVTFLGLVDGRPAALGRVVRSPRGGFLIAGGVAPWARGRGLYRALVRARFEQAAAWGTPAVVTQASPETSLPILLRLGFEEACVLERLEDPRA
jgi:GNAT superfamily N-acetyltransferase